MLHTNRPMSQSTNAWSFDLWIGTPTEAQAPHPLFNHEQCTGVSPCQGGAGASPIWTQTHTHTHIHTRTHAHTYTHTTHTTHYTLHTLHTLHTCTHIHTHTYTHRCAGALSLFIMNSAQTGTCTAADNKPHWFSCYRSQVIKSPIGLKICLNW